MRSGTDFDSGHLFNATPGSVRFLVRLTPRAARNSFDGLVRESDGRPVLRFRVTAPPVKGAANAALVAYVSNALDLRKSEVRIISGQTARLKLLELSGDADLIAARLTEWIGASDTRGS
ncbi:MAG TPA: DUF167 domain-containing protein [Chthoniobacterales bacterium]|nr:DUF167 domain-containing protein [Chthoniobacterales bacterium]